MKDQLNSITSNLNFIKKLFDSVLTVPAAAREFDKRLSGIFSDLNQIDAVLGAGLRRAKAVAFKDYTSGIGVGLKNGRWAASTASLEDPLVKELVDAVLRLVHVTEGNPGRRQLSNEQTQAVIDDAYSFAMALARGEDIRLDAARADEADKQSQPVEAKAADRMQTIQKLHDLRDALEAGSYNLEKAAGEPLMKAGEGRAFAKQMSGEPLKGACEAKGCGQVSCDLLTCKNG